jgi:hypothetical protein
MRDHCNATEVAALRACAQFAWDHRDDLTAPQLEQMLIAWIAVGTDAEGQAASELLEVRRKLEAQQLKFTQLLKAGNGAP